MIACLLSYPLRNYSVQGIEAWYCLHPYNASPLKMSSASLHPYDAVGALDGHGAPLHSYAPRCWRPQSTASPSSSPASSSPPSSSPPPSAEASPHDSSSTSNFSVAPPGIFGGDPESP
eukprot:CAMPEP_0119298562 /NCGR_PEP_ID=MMETSP1333-20130426/725_1 /TAXON_ID=418940 /ORGANISM="Scyphosphaera apsteinii, Strain RCC1455" /LENGTH=117 /DNA_ID=CAMNT_0007299691 /DNA_START=203 /DNA_END=556 /DNA_ORIENTATION=+